MVLSKIKKKCACCGKEVEVDIIESCYINDTYLDGTSNIDFGDNIQECPNCHYVNIDIEKSMPNMDEIKQQVQSEEYQEQNQLYNDDSTLNIIQRCSAFYNLYNNSQYEDYMYNSILALLSMCRKLNHIELYDDEITYRKYAIDLFEQYFDLNMEQIDFYKGLLYLDCLRQISDFEGAEEMIEVLKQTYDNESIFDSPKDYILLVFEKQLIDNKDNKPYKMSEVQLI